MPKFTLGCILSPLVMNSAVPSPASAIPRTRCVEAPEPMPNEKHLQKEHHGEIAWYIEKDNMKESVHDVNR